MYRLDENTRERLITRAENYNNLQLFIDELGWEDWMNDFTDATYEGEEITETEAREIDIILTEIFAIAYNKNLDE